MYISINISVLLTWHLCQENSRRKGGRNLMLNSFQAKDHSQRIFGRKNLKAQEAPNSSQGQPKAFGATQEFNWTTFYLHKGWVIWFSYQQHFTYPMHDLYFSFNMMEKNTLLFLMPAQCICIMALFLTKEDLYFNSAYCLFLFLLCGGAE